MGKIKRVTMISAVALLLAACSGEQGSAPQPPASPVAESDSPSSDEGSATPAEAEAIQPGIAIQSASRTDLRNFGTFTYMTGATTGLSPDAATAADERIAGMVDAAVRAAVLSDDGECLEGEPQCGYFVQTLTPLPCIESYLCVKQEVTFAGVGMAISDPSVEVLVIDPTTGRTVGIDNVVGEPFRRAFLDAVNAEVTSVQKSEEVFTDLDRPNFSEGDFAAWAPLADGIHVWFPKYTAGPGFLGIVEVAVPYPTDGGSSQEAGEADSPRAAKGVSIADDAALDQVLADLGWNADPAWCRQVTLSNRAPDWGVFDESSEAFDNPDSCILSDAFSYVGKVQGKWQFLDYAGSSVDTCSGIRGGLADEGMPKMAIEDFIDEWGCLNDDEFGDAPFEDTPPSDNYADDPILPPAPNPAAPAPAAPQPVAPPAPTSAAVPSVVGLPASTAQSILQAAGFRMSPAAPMGSSAYIKTQAPPAGTQMALGSTVSVFFAF